MASQNRDEYLSAALLAALLVTLLALAAASVSAPVSTPIDFVLDEAVQRDGPEALPRDPAGDRPVLTMAFTGDIMQHRLQATDDFGECYGHLGTLLAESDLTVANLGFPVDITRPVGPPVGSVQFNGSPAHIAALAKAGFDVLSTANERCFDQGLLGLERTRRLIRRFGISTVGGLGGAERDQPLVVERNGIRVGFFGYTFRPHSYANARGEIEYWHQDWPVHELNFGDWTDEYRAEGLRVAARHVQVARSLHVDFLVALVHWGREWHFQPTQDQRLAGRDLIEQGFDLVVGGHGHVLNPMEVYRGHLIAYSLGNLVSDFRPLEARTGAVLHVEVARTSTGRLQVTGFGATPVVTERAGHRVRPVRAHGAADQAARDLARMVMGPACVLR